MSAAAALKPRKPARSEENPQNQAGFNAGDPRPLADRVAGPTIRIPRALIRAMWAIVDGELRFCFVLWDKSNNEYVWCAVTDAEWVKYTGMSVRAKEYAIKGLQEKGLLKVEGKGDKARYLPAPSKTWVAYAAQCDRTLKARTAGRAEAAKTAKPGMQVHPECHSRGCQMLCGVVGRSDQSENQASPKIRPPSVSVPLPGRSSEEKANTTSSLESTKLTQFAQPVAQNSRFFETYSGTLSKLQTVAPATDVAFLKRLLDAVVPIFGQVSDAELLAAVELAWRQKSGYQKGPGLFLDTIPEALRVLRARGGAGRGVVTGGAKESPTARGNASNGKSAPSSEEDEWERVKREHREAELKRLGLDSSGRRIKRSSASS